MRLESYTAVVSTDSDADSTPRSGRQRSSSIQAWLSLRLTPILGLLRCPISLSASQRTAGACADPLHLPLLVDDPSTCRENGRRRWTLPTPPTSRTEPDPRAGPRGARTTSGRLRLLLTNANRIHHNPSDSWAWLIHVYLLSGHDKHRIRQGPSSTHPPDPCSFSLLQVNTSAVAH